MKKHILRNRHSLLLTTVAVFCVLILLEAALSNRSLFNLEVDNSFFQFRVGDSLILDDLELLEDFPIDF